MKLRIYMALLICIAVFLGSCVTYYPSPLYDDEQTDFEANKGTGEIEVSYGRISGTQIVNAFGTKEEG